jgi:hypothetical protein
MPVNRKLYTSHITQAGSPHYRCPECTGGHYRLVKGSLKSQRTADTKKIENEPWFDAEFDELRFIAMLTCDNDRCGEVAVVAGKGWVDYWHDDEGKRLYEKKFLPYHLQPSPLLIAIPEGCPEDVRKALEFAFLASWSDFAAAGNHIRSTTERILDSLKVRKQITTKKNKRQRYSLHERIETLATSHSEVYDSFMAIKWLGNAASHSNVLTRDGVFDALDILESVLDRLYSEHPAALKLLVRKVNARRGPIPAQ